MARQTVFTDNEFWRCFWAHAMISITESCLFYMQCLKINGMGFIFLPCPLHIEISPDSQNYFIMYCRLWDIQSLQFYVEEHYSEMVPQYVDAGFRSLVNLCPSLLLRDCLSKIQFLYPIMLLTCLHFNRLVANVPPAVYFLQHALGWLLYLLFPDFYCRRPNFFETCCGHQIPNSSIFSIKLYIYWV